MVTEEIELNSKTRVDEKVKELKSQLSLREKEISSLKTFYAEKLKMKADEIASIKAEHSRVQQEYLDEIRELRREIDRMAYDSKRLALSHSNQTTCIAIVTCYISLSRSTANSSYDLFSSVLQL